MFNFVGRRFWFFLITGVVLLVCIVSLATLRLKPGIELSSGSLLTLRFEQKINQSELNQALAELGYGNAIVQHTGAGDFLIRTKELTGDAKTKLETALKDKFGEVKEAEFNSVSPMIAAETASNAGIAVAVAAVGILLYVTWAFRRMPRPFHYGTCAIISLVHDAVVALGVFSILGGVLGWEINLMFITGILAVIGYSVNNTVVVFDRIRENQIKGVSPHFEVVVNNSIVETMPRCLNTSFTTMITLLALIIFVGSSIQNFVVVMLVGLIAGTYSSSFVAPALLVVWDKGEWGRFLQWLPISAAKARSR